MTATTPQFTKQATPFSRTNLESIWILCRYVPTPIQRAGFSLKVPTARQGNCLRSMLALYGGHAAIVVLLRKGDMTDSSAKLYGAGSDFAKADSHLSNDAKRIFAVRKRAVTIVKRRREDIDRLAGV